MAAILDAILNFTPSARDPDCRSTQVLFTYLGVYFLYYQEWIIVKMRGHLIAHN